MKTFARIQNNQALDVVDFDPYGRFHPDVAALYQEVPNHVRPNAKLIDGVWVNPPEPAPPTPEQIAAQQAAIEESMRIQAADQVRKERNARLLETDWLVIKAFETNANIPGVWEVYRQSLRDVPQQAGFPWEVTWPVAPE